MPRHCDEDSGRSSCSAGSFQVSPILEMVEETDTVKLSNTKSHATSTNTNLKVSIRPRSYTGILKSPNERDPFPSCRLNCNAVFNILDTPRKGGLSNAKSTFDLASSTQIEHGIVNAKSMTALRGIDDKCYKTNFRRGKPVQRAASRLYQADVVRGERKECVGPEFIVRASQEPKSIDLTLPNTSDKKIVNIVLLNGHTVRVLCDPNTITAGQLFEAIVKSEKYEHNFMLGIAVLITGDFIFLPDEYKVKKVAPENWFVKNAKKVSDDVNFIVFLRIKFFLPTNIARNIQGGDWRHRVYLQLRRSTVEGQLTSTLQNLIMLAGYALHIEFGEFTFREHGSGDYFLLEHYLPESLITNNMTDTKLKMKRAHETRRGLDRSRAIINYITLAQTFRDYGGHFYSAVWATRDGFCRDVWLSIGPKGVTLYSRNNISALPKDSENTPNRIVLQSLPWHHIHTFYYNKKSLYIIPNNNSGFSKMGVKYKLRMADNKSYFSFWLASLHHRLYLKLYAKEDFVNYLSDELSCPLENSPAKNECSNYQDSYNIAVRNQYRKPLKRRFKVDLFDRKANKENDKPSTEDMLRQILSPPPEEDSNISPISNKGNSSNDGLSSSESCSLPRRHGVKMGTRVFNGMKTKLPNRYPQSPPYSGANSLTRSDGDLATTQSDSDDLCSNSGKILQNCKIDSMKLLPERQYIQNTSQSPTAYVIESPKVYKDAFSYNLNNTESCVNASLYERLDNMGCVQGERIFVTATLQRDEMNTLGVQVAEGSDGNVYIKSITSGGPADSSKKLTAGDQIISVNGQTLLNVKYEKALAMLQSAPHTVELIVLQNSSKCPENADKSSLSSLQEKFTKLQRDRSIDDIEITDDELLNEEALKTIYALIKLTKDKVINRIKQNGSLNTPNRRYLQKCLSENKVYDESDYSNYSSQENTPEKYDKQKFNTWRGHVNYRPKRRPLSLSFPADVNVPDDYFKEEMVIKKSSLKDIKSSLNDLDKNGHMVRNIALPRNYGLSRKWIGPVRYPVTPCKNDIGPSGLADDNVVKRHFIYGVGDSDEDQIFL